MKIRRTRGTMYPSKQSSSRSRGTAGEKHPDDRGNDDVPPPPKHSRRQSTTAIARESNSRPLTTDDTLELVKAVVEALLTSTPAPSPAAEQNQSSAQPRCTDRGAPIDQPSAVQFQENESLDMGKHVNQEATLFLTHIGYSMPC